MEVRPCIMAQARVLLMVMCIVMQCVDGKEVLAIYEAGQASRDYSALLTIRHPGLAVVTEILTTLMLSHMAILLQWQS